MSSGDGGSGGLNPPSSVASRSIMWTKTLPKLTTSLVNGSAFCSRSISSAMMNVTAGAFLTKDRALLTSSRVSALCLALAASAHIS